MSSSRARAALAIGSVCIFLLFLLLPQISPDPVQAAWDPKIANGTPRDPGTPFEEPEGGGPGDTADPSGRPLTGGGGQQLTPKPNVAPAVTKAVVRRIVLPRLILVLWHLP